MMGNQQAMLGLYGSTPITKTQLLEYQLRQARPEFDRRLVLILSLR